MEITDASVHIEMETLYPRSFTEEEEELVVQEEESWRSLMMGLGDMKDEEAMEVDSEGIKIEADQRSLSVDYALYAKFWQLQDFFRNPNQCYANVKWKTFSNVSFLLFNCSDKYYY